MEQNNANPANRNPYTLWFVVLAFVAPVVVAYVMYFSGAITTYSNNGEILNPIVDVADFKLKDDKNVSVSREALTRKWRLISFVGAECDEACNARLYDSRQVHKSLGKDQERVERLIVHLEPAGSALSGLIKSDYPKAINVYGSEKIISDVLGAGAGISKNEIYLVDPIGNVMMRFSNELTKKEIKSDLKKLLKVSQIG
jgi:cytochrome oxidase Cu insertion factor (SCO1/SenC/PrrC family)